VGCKLAICIQLLFGIRSLAVRIVTFENERGTSVGALVPDGVVDLAELLPAGTPQAMLEALIDGFEDVRGAIDALPARPVSEVRLRASVPDPGKVLCVMRNRPGLEEGDAPPYAYLKYAGGGVGSGDALRLPAESSLWFAPALAVVVRGPVRDIAPEDWREAVFGFTGFVDVVRPGSEFPGGDDWWKSWDTPFAVGPAIVTVDEVPAGLGLTVGTVTATDPGRPPVADIVSFLSGVMTLRTGDLIALGAHDAAVVPVSAGSVELDVPGGGRLVVEATA